MQIIQPPVPAAQQTVPTSTVKLLNSRYRLVKRLGEGTYGDVFLAKDTLNENRLVAIKRERFVGHRKEGQNKTGIREMSLLQELGSGPAKHPNIVELIDIFQLRDGSPCIVIEFVEKGSLMGLLQGDLANGS